MNKLEALLVFFLFSNSIPFQLPTATTRNCTLNSSLMKMFCVSESWVWFIASQSIASCCLTSSRSFVINYKIICDRETDYLKTIQTSIVRWERVKSNVGSSSISSFLQAYWFQSVQQKYWWRLRRNHNNIASSAVVLSSKNKVSFHRVMWVDDRKEKRQNQCKKTIFQSRLSIWLFLSFWPSFVRSFFPHLALLNVLKVFALIFTFTIIWSCFQAIEHYVSTDLSSTTETRWESPLVSAVPYNKAFCPESLFFCYCLRNSWKKICNISTETGAKENGNHFFAFVNWIFLLWPKILLFDYAGVPFVCLFGILRKLFARDNKIFMADSGYTD